VAFKTCSVCHARHYKSSHRLQTEVFAHILKLFALGYWHSRESLPWILQERIMLYDDQELLLAQE
jgi:hypothetical protein